MKKQIEDIWAKTNALKSEYNWQRGGHKPENKDLIKSRAEALKLVVEKLLEGLK